MVPPSQVVETPITTKSLATPFMSVLESIPESCNESASASEFHFDFQAKRPPEALGKMTAHLEARSAKATMPKPIKSMKPRLRQTRLMSSVADHPLRSVRVAGNPNPQIQP